MDAAATLYLDVAGLSLINKEGRVERNEALAENLDCPVPRGPAEVHETLPGGRSRRERKSDARNGVGVYHLSKFTRDG